jgi:hypothetical protein
MKCDDSGQRKIHVELLTTEKKGIPDFQEPGWVGETYPGSQGNQLNYNNLCFPETEDGLPAGNDGSHQE